MTGYDLIIGAGHNGITPAAVLGQHGADVLVLEKSSFPGGMAATRELLPGFKHSIGAWSFIVYTDEKLKPLVLMSRWGFELIDQWASFCTFGVRVHRRSMRPHPYMHTDRAGASDLEAWLAHLPSGPPGIARAQDADRVAVGAPLP